MKRYGGVIVSIRVDSITPRSLYLRGKNPHYPLDGRLGGTQSHSGRHGAGRNLASTDTRTPTPSAVQHVTSRNIEVIG
jgi:hypothetical protein